MQSSTRFALFWAVVALCATGAQAADGDQVAPFFGFMGAMSALVFSCTVSYTHLTLPTT